MINDGELELNIIDKVRESETLEVPMEDIIKFIDNNYPEFDIVAEMDKYMKTIVYSKFLDKEEKYKYTCRQITSVREILLVAIYLELLFKEFPEKESFNRVGYLTSLSHVGMIPIEVSSCMFLNHDSPIYNCYTDNYDECEIENVSLCLDNEDTIELGIMGNYKNLSAKNDEEKEAYMQGGLGYLIMIINTINLNICSFGFSNHPLDL